MARKAGKIRTHNHGTPFGGKRQHSNARPPRAVKKSRGH
jgi:hypothetical protein